MGAWRRLRRRFNLRGAAWHVRADCNAKISLNQENAAYYRMRGNPRN
jgi:hypothetical protein